MTYNPAKHEDAYAAPPPKPTFVETYCTLGVVIPSLLILAFASFLLFEFVIPEVRDLTAFRDAPPGIAAYDPIKRPSNVAPFMLKGTHGLYTHKFLYQVEPVSDYMIEARVLHKRHYYSDKNTADLIPFDMGLGWKAMSDVAILRKYFTFHHYNQGGGRMLWWVPSKDTPRELLAEGMSGLHFSNNHLIPTDDHIYETIRQMSAGDFVRLKGFLVNVTSPEKPDWQWITTKRVREDPNKEFQWGNGDAQDNMTDCDTMFVTEAEILKEPTPPPVPEPAK